MLPRERLRQTDFQTPVMLALRLKSYRPRLIPYRAVGVSEGMLLALPCSLTMDKQTWRGLAAFSPTPLSGGAYQALVGAAIPSPDRNHSRKERILC